MTGPDPGSAERLMYAATIWVTGPARVAIDALRIRWDSQQGAVGPHMTVVYPQAVAAATLIQARAADLIRDRSSFEVTLGRVADFETLAGLDEAGTSWLTQTFSNFRNPIVLLPTAGGSAVLELRHRLDAVFQQETVVLDHPPFVTIGQGLDDQEAANAVRSLADYDPGLTFKVDSVDILELDDVGAWRSLGEASLST